MAFNPPQGPRLPYVVRKLEGTIARTKYRFNRRIGKIEPYEVEEEEGLRIWRGLRDQALTPRL